MAGDGSSVNMPLDGAGLTWPCSTVAIGPSSRSSWCSRQGRERTVAQGLEQVMRYRDTIDRGADAWLVVFDRTVAGRRKSWEERLTWEPWETTGGIVTLVGG